MRTRVLATAAAAGLVLSGVASAAHALATDPEPSPTPGPAPTAAGDPLLLVHGFNADGGTQCSGEGGVWQSAQNYYATDGNRDTTTIGYYTGDTACEDTISQSTPDTPIQDVAKDFANYIYDKYTSNGQSVDVVAHSMGGLVTRVAVLGTSEDWSGFPTELKIGNIATLSTPHQGIADPGKYDAHQWDQMIPYQSDGGTGFINKLHESAPGAKDRGLDQFEEQWAQNIDWSLVGSDQDTTVEYSSGIDKGYWADQKYGFDTDRNDNGEQDCAHPRDSSGEFIQVTHGSVRTLTGAGGYCLQYWHSGADGGPYFTEDGWSPLKVGYKAATYIGDDLPR